ncbi:hypothetical protein HDA32_005534 [Spinactinospora alkalitolerans]|uniref:Uncharacterized protein n=1 Tax=Spinactinospora alkalitolerans TaxID=687207 RepID=A0A852U8J8_9ACTN|nr:hypothetical protein [Spinactinospora alkalitolerans]NYE50414.1 hypothetical protein [Spinactinospora alkalitolerans]
MLKFTRKSAKAILLTAGVAGFVGLGAGVASAGVASPVDDAARTVAPHTAPATGLTERLSGAVPGAPGTVHTLPAAHGCESSGAHGLLGGLNGTNGKLNGTNGKLNGTAGKLEGTVDGLSGDVERTVPLTAPVNPGVAAPGVAVPAEVSEASEDARQRVDQQAAEAEGALGEAEGTLDETRAALPGTGDAVSETERLRAGAEQAADGAAADAAEVTESTESTDALPDAEAVSEEPASLTEEPVQALEDAADVDSVDVATPVDTPLL